MNTMQVLCQRMHGPEVTARQRLRAEGDVHAAAGCAAPVRNLPTFGRFDHIIAA